MTLTGPIALAATFAMALTACSSGGEAPRSPTPGQGASPSLESAATEAATALIAFAEGGRSEVPWADVVTYYVHGEQVARFGADIADRPETWQGCPPRATTYEGRDCPVSPLATMQQEDLRGGELRIESAAPRTVGCNRAMPPEDVDAAASAWVRPDHQHRDCFSDFAVTLYLDRSSRVSAVDLALSGP